MGVGFRVLERAYWCTFKASEMFIQGHSSLKIWFGWILRSESEGSHVWHSAELSLSPALSRAEP